MLAGGFKRLVLPVMFAFVLLVSVTANANKPQDPSLFNEDKLASVIPNLPVDISGSPYNPQKYINAHQSLRCDTVWTNASAENDFLACLQNSDRIKSQWKAMVVPIINVVTLSLLVVGFPLAFCITTCHLCCRSDVSRRGTETARCCIWLWIVYAMLCGLIVCVFVILGASTVVKAIPQLVNDVNDGPVEYFNSTAENVLNFMSNWSTGKREPLEQFKLDLTPFTTVQDQVRNALDLAREKFFEYLQSIAIATYALGSVGFVLILLILPFACCRCCIPCFPLALSCCYWIFGLAFAVMGLIINVLSYVFSSACGERELQYSRRPGVFQWYVIPLSRSKFDFEEINKVVFKAEGDLTKDSCKKLLEACDNEADPSVEKVATSFRNLFVGLTAATASANDMKAKNIPIPSGKSNPAVSSLGQSISNQNINGKDVLETVSKVSREVPKDAKVLGVDPSKVDPKKTDLSKLNVGDPKAAAEALAKLGAKGVPKDVDLSKLAAGLPKDIQMKLPKNFDPNNIPKEVEKFVKENFKNFSSLKPLRCGMNITKPEDCTDFATMAHVLLTTSVKGITGVCPTPGKPCDLVECAYNCTNPTIVGIARQALEAAMLARNASIALSFAKPLLEWNFMIDKMADSLETCRDFRMGTYVLGVGFLVGSLTFMLGTYISMRGSCIWKNTPSRFQKNN